MIVKLLTEHHLEFLSFKGGCSGSSESTLVKMSNCWKSHAMAQYDYFQVIMVFFVGYQTGNQVQTQWKFPEKKNDIHSKQIFN